jgi:hypothetical protein
MLHRASMPLKIFLCILKKVYMGYPKTEAGFTQKCPPQGQNAANCIKDRCITVINR